MIVNMMTEDALVFFMSSNSHLSNAATCLLALAFVVLVITGFTKVVKCLHSCFGSQHHQFAIKGNENIEAHRWVMLLLDRLDMLYNMFCTSTPTNIKNEITVDSLDRTQNESLILQHLPSAGW